MWDESASSRLFHHRIPAEASSQALHGSLLGFISQVPQVRRLLTGT